MATLLIVDDDNLIRDMLHDLLSPSHECHTADRAEQALAYLDIETYDAVLTDISMPGLSGREILKNIQAKHPATPVIVISGLSNQVDAKELTDMGAFGIRNSRRSARRRFYSISPRDRNTIQSYLRSKKVGQAFLPVIVVGGHPGPPLQFSQPRRHESTKLIN